MFDVGRSSLCTFFLDQSGWFPASGTARMKQGSETDASIQL
jgi:hypothetical protein